MDKIRLPHQHGDGDSTALLQEELDRIDYFQTVAEVFKQLDDTTRIRIFWLLCHCEECVLNIYYRAADTEQCRLLHQMIERVMEITCPER